MATDRPPALRLLPIITARLQARPDPGDLSRLQDGQHLVDTAERVLGDIARQAHAAGRTWGEIGATLGMSRQGARQRWGLVVERAAAS